jgi:ERCC4-type nuclease
MTSKNTDTEPYPDEMTVEEFLDTLPGVGSLIQVKLEDSGFKTLGDIRQASKSELCQAEYVGPNTANRILTHATSHQPRNKESPDPSHSSESPLDLLQEEVPTVGRVTTARLKNSGYETLADFQNINKDQLAQVPTVGPRTADQILSVLKQHNSLDEQNKQNTAKNEDGEREDSLIDDIVSEFTDITDSN